ncbi:MAG: GNAT family N-acetyltransferase [Chloroflexota bacterium]
MTPAWVGRIRLPLVSRFTARTLADHLRAHPGMAFVADGGRQYAIAGPWRRRAEIAELIEAGNGRARSQLLAALTDALTRQGVELLVLDDGSHAVDRDLCRDAGLMVIERIVEYRRPTCQVEPRSSTLEIRAYTPADRDAVLAVERESFPWLWWNSQEEWDAYVASLGVDVLLGIERGRLIGYASTTIYHTDGHLDRLAVREGDQGRGFGSALLLAALAQLDRAGARRVRLTTQEDNVRSQSLYQRHGFRAGGAIYEIYGKRLKAPEGSRP